MRGRQWIQDALLKHAAAERDRAVGNWRAFRATEEKVAEQKRNELDRTPDSGSMKLGLLMETAQSQKLAEAAIGKLNEHTRALEAVVRDEVRQVPFEELTTVRAETHGAIRSLQALRSLGGAGSAALEVRDALERR